jgi:hypothetical protein
MLVRFATTSSRIHVDGGVAQIHETRKGNPVPRKFAFLATVAAVATIPQIAQASCSGNACDAYSALAAWSSSEKRVNTVLTNKDSTKPVHLKLCVTVDGKCNRFDLTLPPRGSMTKSVSVNGGAAPPKFAVDVSTAEFPAGQAATQGAGPAQGSGAIKAVETPFGQITYFATHDESPNLTKAVSDFVKGQDLYKKLRPRAIALNAAAQKVGSLKEIEAEIRKTVNANPTLPLKAGYALSVKRDLENLSETFRLVGELAGNAARNLSVTEKELEASRDQETAFQLRAEAERERQRVSALVKIINEAMSAVDAFQKAESGDIAGLAAKAWGEADKVVALFTNADELTTRAQELEAKARKLSAEAVAQRFKDAEQMLSTLQRHLADLKPKLHRYRTDYETALAKAQKDFDNDNAKNKGHFNFSNINALIAEAKAINVLAAETRRHTNAAREYMRLYRSVRKDWMADPAGNEKVMQQIFDTADWMTQRVDEMVQETEMAQAQLQDTYAKAMKMAGP